MSGSRQAWLVIGLLTALVGIFLIVPSLLMAISSLSAGDTLDFPPEGLSLRWFGALLRNNDIRSSFVNTFEVSLICTVLGVLVGAPASVAMARCNWKIKPLIELFLFLPFIIPAVVTAVGFLMVYGAAGLLGRPWALAVALCAFNIPFMIGAITATVNRLDPHLEEAAASSGARPVERFITVTLPTIMPGVISGALLLFVLTFNEYVVSSFLVDVRSMTLPVEVFNQGRGVTTPLMAAISVLYLAISIVAIVTVDRLVGIESFFRSGH